jgi:hypothetical protein
MPAPESAPPPPGRRLNRKHLIKAAILAVWLGLLGWWQLESLTWPPPEKIEAAFIPDHYDLFALNYKGQKVGWAFKSLKRFPGGGYQAAQGLRLQAALPGRTLEIQTDISANLSPVLDLVSFTQAVASAPVAVTEQGRVENGRLVVRVSLGEYEELARALLDEHRDWLGVYADLLDFRRPADLPAPDGPGLAPLAGPYLGYLGLTKGANYRLAVLDPFTRTLKPLEARVEAETRQYDPEIAGEAAAFLVRTGPPEAGAGLWLDRFGRTLKEEAFGFTLLLVDNQEEARRDITPFSPPPALMAMLESGAWTDLLAKLRPEQAGQLKP